MGKKPSRHERADKAGASDPGDESAMERFKDLARRVVNVSNQRVLEERAKEEGAKKRKRVARK